ncbi:MAG TPA: hypothetical protein VI112_06535 [Bacteroidia bacterium]|jgi:hypothetical protein
MSTEILLHQPVNVQEALREARQLGFIHRFFVDGSAIRWGRKKYDPVDVAIVDQREVKMGGRTGMLYYLVSCDGELGVALLREGVQRLKRTWDKILLK